ncbi:MAG: cytidylate kinase family protein, partial [Clostridia bacterium]
MDNICITIGREFGSGGREIAKKLSEMLNMKYYDKELLELASQSSGISLDVFENVDEKRSVFFSDGLVGGQGNMLGNFYSFSDTLSSDNLFIHKMETIKKIA